MATRSSDYWRKRTLQLENALNNKSVTYFHELEKAYQQAARETEKEILKLYTRLATENNITLTEARKMLTGNELKEFRWSVEEYIKYGKENAVNGQWVKQLENASLRYRISRLEAMKIQMQNQAEVLMGNELDGFSKAMSDIYTEGYYRNAHIIQTGFGVGSSFAALDPNRVNKVLSKPWAADGINFSERIWGKHRPQLINELHTQLTQSIIRGEAPDKAIKAIAQKFNVAKNRAGNLVMTESAYFGTQAQQDCYKELEVEMQEFVATLDNHTSAICQDMDGQVFKSSEVVVGVNAPPLHCRCRSVMVPYFEDNITERAARDENGKTVYIPGNMKYKDWYEQFVGDNEKVEKAVAIIKLADILKTDKEGRYKLADFEIKRETEKAYLLKKEGLETWIPKKIVNTDGFISKKFSEEIKYKIIAADKTRYYESILGKYKFWRPDNSKIERIYFDDGSYAERFWNLPRKYGEHGEYTSQYIGGDIVEIAPITVWKSSGSGIAAEKIKYIEKLFGGDYDD